MKRNWANYDDILTVEDVKGLLGIGTRSARALMKEEGAVKIAGKWMISKAKIKQMFE